MRVITCCYCGARSTLSSKRATRLVCHGCGAAIRKIETLQPDFERMKKRTDRRKPAIPHRAERPHDHLAKDRPVRRKKGKRKQRSVWSRLSDQVDDIFDLDDLFDIEDWFD